MDMYSIQNEKLTYIDGMDFRLEVEIQRICEDNLDLLFGLQKVKSEFILQNLRIDTLAYNTGNRSFVVVEYKKDKNFSVIDQGYAYLSLILNNKADCILEYNECFRKPLKREDVDWSQTRVMFIGPSFTQYQVQSINFKDLPIELWEIRKYVNNTIFLSQIQPSASTESVNIISSKSKTFERVTKEIKVHTEDDHLLIASEEIKEFYDRLKASLLGIGSQVKVRPTKKYIGFISKTNFVDIHVQKKALKLWLNIKAGELDDPKNLARDVSNIGHWGNGDYELHIPDDQEMDYIIGLIKQSYRRNS